MNANSIELILLGVAIVALVLGLAGAGSLRVFAMAAIGCVAVVMLSLSGAL